MNEHINTWIAMRALIADPIHWTTHVTARDRSGIPCDIFDKHAFALCFGGAARRVTNDPDKAMEACGALADLCGIPRKGFPGSVNDNMGHAYMIAMLDKGIASATDISVFQNMLKQTETV